jgi:hypothetical protein
MDTTEDPTAHTAWHNPALWIVAARANGARDEPAAPVGSSPAPPDHVDLGVTTILIRGSDPADHGPHLMPLAQEPAHRSLVSA